MAKEIVELEVKSNIKDAAQDTEKLVDGLQDATTETENLSDATKKGKSGFKGLTGAVKGLGTGFKALGLGLIIGLFTQLKEVFSQNQKVMDFFNTAFETTSIMFNDLFGFLSNNVGTVIGYFKDLFENPKQHLKEMGTAIQENLIERFESFLDTMGHIGSAITKLFAGDFSGAVDSVKDAGKEAVDVFTGVNNSVDKTVEVFDKVTTAVTEYTKSVVNSAAANVQLKKDSELAQVQVQGLIEDFDRQAEKLRQVRDDETKTFAERIKANEDLGKVLKEQETQMLALVDIQIKAAQVEFDKNQSQENLIALTEALNEKKGVEAQITGFQSEQLTNQVSLEKELLETKAEVIAEGLNGMQRELAELEASYKEKKRLAKLSGQDTVAITKQFEKQKSLVVQENANAQLEAAAGLMDALGSLAGENKALAIGSAIINTYVGVTKAIAQGGVAGILTGATVLASGLANVKKILETDVGDGGGGGSVPTAEAETPAPEMLSGKFELGGGVAPEPVKAYVVTDEMTNSQDQLANIRRRATI